MFVDPLANLPADFDQLGATLENAARLRAAGVEVGFTQVGDASHNARKMRQLAGNAVANGLPWEDGLAGLTRVPAEAFGVGDRLGAHRARHARRPGAVETAIRSRSPPSRGRSGSAASAIPMRRARPNCATATCARRRRAKRGELPRAYPAVVR